MGKRNLAALGVALALLATPSFAAAGVHVSLGFGLPLPFGLVVAPPAVVVPAPVYAPPPVYYYPYPPVVAPYGYYGGPAFVYRRHFHGRAVGWYRHGHHDW